MRADRICLRLVLASLFLAGTAHAMPTAKLVYVRAPGAETCPDEDALRTEVEKRLGYKPFRVVADNTLFAEVRRGAPGFVADVKLIGADGVTRGVRHLESQSADCGDIARTMALSMSIALDPLSLTRPAGTPPPDDTEEPPEPPPVVKPEEPAPPPPPPPPAPPPPPPAERAWNPSLGIGGGASVGMSPDVAPTLSLLAALRYRFVSAETGFLAQLPVPSGTSQGGKVETRLLVVPVSMCGHAWRASLCALSLLGDAHGESSGITSPRSQSLFFAAVGPRLGLTVLEASGVFVRLNADVLFPVTPFSLSINGQSVWASNAVMGLFSAHVGYPFP